MSMISVENAKMLFASSVESSALNAKKSTNRLGAAAIQKAQNVVNGHA